MCMEKEATLKVLLSEANKREVQKKRHYVISAIRLWLSRESPSEGMRRAQTRLTEEYVVYP